MNTRSRKFVKRLSSCAEPGHNTTTGESRTSIYSIPSLRPYQLSHRDPHIFIYIRTLCMRAAKALARLCECAGSSEPSLFASTISTRYQDIVLVYIISNHCTFIESNVIPLQSCDYLHSKGLFYSIL